MGDMGVRHEKVVIANNSFSVSGGGTTMDGGEFPDHVAVADPGPAFFTLVFEVLGRSPHRSQMKYVIVFTDLSPFTDNRMGTDHSSCTYGNLFFNNSVRTDLNPGSHLCRGVNNSSGMY